MNRGAAWQGSSVQSSNLPSILVWWSADDWLTLCELAVGRAWTKLRTLTCSPGIPAGVGSRLQTQVPYSRAWSSWPALMSPSQVPKDGSPFWSSVMSCSPLDHAPTMDLGRSLCLEVLSYKLIQVLEYGWCSLNPWESLNLIGHYMQTGQEKDLQ